MREIKFRAWDIYNNEIIQNSMLIEEEINPIEKNLTFNLMQYTGLKDKNGVEIYEGDILKRNNRNYVIKITPAGVLGDSTDGVIMNWNIWVWSDSMEIIGNIYENKELL